MHRKTVMNDYFTFPQIMIKYLFAVKPKSCMPRNKKEIQKANKTVENLTSSTSFVYQKANEDLSLFANPKEEQFCNYTNCVVEIWTLQTSYKCEYWVLKKTYFKLHNVLYCIYWIYKTE